jgi:hypothetical protein
MSGEIVIALALGGMFTAFLIVLGILRSAARADRFLEQREPTDPCAEGDGNDQAEP